jgi:hypothetical protein
MAALQIFKLYCTCVSAGAVGMPATFYFLWFISRTWDKEFEDVCIDVRPIIYVRNAVIIRSRNGQFAVLELRARIISDDTWPCQIKSFSPVLELTNAAGVVIINIRAE